MTNRNQAERQYEQRIIKSKQQQRFDVNNDKYSSIIISTISLSDQFMWYRNKHQKVQYISPSPFESSLVKAMVLTLTELPSPTRD